jgi:choline dehydrogenase-like flavoprotein
VASDPSYDLVVIGSSFGGVMAAYPAVMAGKSVLMIERGDWVPRDRKLNWGRTGFVELTSAYSRDAPYKVLAGGAGDELGTIACVGGASVFFGGVAIRLRERDFEPDPEIVNDSGAQWPYRYADLEPFYAEAELLLRVAGAAGDDPFEPWRSAPYPQKPAPLAPESKRLLRAARRLGLKPFRLPLAINYSATDSQQACIACNTCDGFACAIHAKNDLSATIPDLKARGMELLENTMAVRLVVNGRRVAHVECVDSRTLEPRRTSGRAVVVAAGALATPHLLLASGLDALSPAGGAIGRYLMRHCNAIVMGAPRFPVARFHKQIGIHDYYYGDPSDPASTGKLGCIQQFATPQTAYVFHYTHGVKRPLAVLTPMTTGLIVIAEDRPQAENRVALESGSPSRFGMPLATIRHEYDKRDLAARDVLVGVARRILREARMVPVHQHDILSFSHAVGTVRLGPDPALAPLDEWGAFRGLDNLYVTDGSALPRSGGVNPSLTIAANALRTGAHIAGTL